MVRTTTSLFLSSDSSTGAITTDNGARMTVILDPPIQLNPTARLTCALHSTDIWYTIPNVSTQLNNDHFRFLDTTTATMYDYTIPKGLYSVSALESSIDDFLINNSLPAGIFKFDPDDATGTISLQINRVGITVYWTDANSVGGLLGFTSDDGPTVTTGLIYESDAQANLNLLTEILLNFSAGGSYFNSRGGSNVIAAISPNVPVGALIQYEPNNLIETRLIGDHHDQISVWLTNANTGLTIDTNGEIFTCTILLFEYTD